MNTRVKIYVLTCEYNEYDQYGEYFRKVYGSLPTQEQLTADGCNVPISHLLNEKEGGRIDDEYMWWYLRQEDVIVDPTDQVRETSYLKVKDELQVEIDRLKIDHDLLVNALVDLAAVARRYLPDYDEHPEIQKKADAAIDASMRTME